MGKYVTGDREKEDLEIAERKDQEVFHLMDVLMTLDGGIKKSVIREIRIAGTGRKVTYGSNTGVDVPIPVHKKARKHGFPFLKW